MEIATNLKQTFHTQTGTFIEHMPYGPILVLVFSIDYINHNKVNEGIEINTYDNHVLIANASKWKQTISTIQYNPASVNNFMYNLDLFRANRKELI